MSTALLLDQGVLFVNQAAIQAIFVSVLLPTPGAAFTRWTDALIGGGVALVAAAVVPRAPLRRPREQAGVVVRKISTLLRAAAESILDGDVERSMVVLRDARSTDELITELRAAADEGLSVVRSSPFRRRHRGPVRAMAELVEPLDFALRNTRVLVTARRGGDYRHQPIPASYAAMLDDLANVTDAIADELGGRPGSHRGPRPSRRSWAGAPRTSSARSDLSAEVMLAQVRSLVADLLAVTGMDPLAATDQIPLLAGLTVPTLRARARPSRRPPPGRRRCARRPHAAAGTTHRAGGSPRSGRGRRLHPSRSATGASCSSSPARSSRIRHSLECSSRMIHASSP